MPIINVYRIVCDRCKATHEGQFRTKIVAGSTARMDGWTTAPVHCPTCRVHAEANGATLRRGL